MNVVLESVRQLKGLNQPAEMEWEAERRGRWWGEVKGIDGTIDWSFFSRWPTLTAAIKRLDEVIMFKEINVSLFSA